MRLRVRSGSDLGSYTALLVPLVAAGAALLLSGTACRAAADDIDARVSRAEQFTSSKLTAKILNAGVTFKWIGDGGHFWYKKALGATHDGYFIVDAATGRQEALFDPQKMAAAMAAAGAASSRGVPRFFEASVSDDMRTITIGLTKPGWTCPGPGPCQERPINLYQCDRPVTVCKALPALLPNDSVLSPDGKLRVYALDHNLWLQDMASGAKRQLTQDGVENFAYGQEHDQDDTLEATRRREGLPEPLEGVQWSPDSHYLLALRHDVRNTPLRLILTEYLPPEGGPPVIHSKHMAVGGDASYPDAALDVISIADGAIHHTKISPDMFSGMAVRYFNGSGAIAARGTIATSSGTWWNTAQDEVWLIGVDRLSKEDRLVHIDLRTGVTKDVIVETGEKRIRYSTDVFDELPGVAVLRSKRQALWWSERDGWGHLYLYDLDTGNLIRQVTSGNWLVADLLHVDEAKRIVYFSAVGKEAGRNPYYRHIYKVSLNGGAPQLLTPEDADHVGAISPDGRYFIDDYSTISEPDQYVLRKTNGSLVSRLLQADISALLKTGWQPPERVVVKAADDKTDLYGVIYKPQNFEPSKKYPVIEIIYPSPSSKFAPTSFREVFNGSASRDAYAFAELGTVVVAVDGRGTAFRSAAFHDVFTGADDPTGIIDHVAAIRNMAATRPYIDLDRIGVTGHSSGGDNSLRAAELFPDFYKVVVSGAGPSDYSKLSVSIAVERTLGMSGGTPEGRAYYDRVSTKNPSLVARLTSKNKVLVVYNGADERVPLQQGFELFQAFQNAGFIYDTLIIPGAGHGGGGEYYTMMRLRYFAEHLGGPR